MLLPQTAEYALRAMACLAMLPEGTALRATDLSAMANIPAPYLSKVLRRLVLDGLLLSQKGHHGGFSLARRPDQISFLEIMLAADFPLENDHCAFGWPRCNGELPCPLHATYSQLKAAFVAWAQRTTLADVDQDSLDALLAQQQMPAI